MFGLWLPNSLVRLPNPVFEYELRRLRGPRDKSDLKRSSLRTVLVVCGIFGVWWLASRGDRYYRSEGNILLLMGFLSFCMMLVSNFYYALLTVGTINRQITSNEWDQLRLTTLNEDRILIAKCAILQIRAWRMMTVDVALRAATVGLIFLILAFSALAYPGGNGFVYFIRDPLAWIVLAAFAVVGATYILEPLWRMRAIVAIGLAVATKVHSFTYAILAMLGSIVLVYLAQIVLVLVCGFILTRIFFPANTSSLYTLYCCAIPVIGIGIFQGYYMFYRALRNRALEYAFRVGLRSKDLRLYVHESYWK